MEKRAREDTACAFRASVALSRRVVATVRASIEPERHSERVSTLSESHAREASDAALPSVAGALPPPPQQQQHTRTLLSGGRHSTQMRARAAAAVHVAATAKPAARRSSCKTTSAQ